MKNDVKKPKKVKQPKKEKIPAKKSGEKGEKKHRFFVVAIAFVLICISFLVMLAITQQKGPSLDDGNLNYDIRIETVSGERGRIFDRNGVLLAGNTTKYKLIFSTMFNFFAQLKSIFYFPYFKLI